MMPTSHLRIATAQVLIADTLSSPFKFKVNTNFNLLMYSLIKGSPLHCLIHLQYAQLFLSFNLWPSSKTILPTLTTFTSLSISFQYLSRQNDQPDQRVYLVLIFPKQLKIIH